MLAIQHYHGGGVLNPTVEHVGDLTHRFSEVIPFGHDQSGDKIDKTLRWLTNPYGFAKEHTENMASNARYRQIPEDKYQQTMEDLLQQYAQAHQQIPVYNEPQWLAKNAAVSLGQQQWDTAAQLLSKLQIMKSKGPLPWHENLLDYQLGEQDLPKQYQP